MDIQKRAKKLGVAVESLTKMNKHLLDKPVKDFRRQGAAVTPKAHRHSYRKDGKCACGVVRLAKK